LATDHSTTETWQLSILIPVLNECSGLDHFMSRLSAALAKMDCSAEFIFVDDGSSDATRDMLKEMNLKDPRVKAIHLSRNFGKERAVAAGLMHTSGNAVVIIDGDLQHPPETIPAFVEQWQAGYDVVYGLRTSRKSDSPLQRSFARRFYALFNAMSGMHLPEGAGDFRLLSRKAVDAMNLLGESQRFNKGLFNWIGFRSVGVPYHVEERADGRSKWSYRRLARFAADGIAAFSIVPLRLASAAGFLTSLAAFSYAAYFLIQTWIFGIDVPGFPSLIISIMFFAGIQLICLGLLGEYLGRVYEEVKRRPLVIIDDLVGFERKRPRTSIGAVSLPNSRPDNEND
jgi:polyisoprenyl-phosphate glycosyltransferase